MKLSIEKEILEAADGNRESQNKLRESVISIAEQIIKEENLDRYEGIEKDDLIRCAILGAEKLLNVLKNHPNMSEEVLSENANYRELHLCIHREMVIYIKLAHHAKRKSRFEKMRKEIEMVSL